MGSNMARRLLRAGDGCVVFDRSREHIKELARENAIAAADLGDVMNKLKTPRALWLMISAAVVDGIIAKLMDFLDPGDILIDVGNLYYVDDIRRAKELALKRINDVDVGTSGGVWGLDRGYCMMIGGDSGVVNSLDPTFRRLAPGKGNIPRTPSENTGKNCSGASSDSSAAPRRCISAVWQNACLAKSVKHSVLRGHRI